MLAYDPFLSRDNILLSELQAELVELDELLARADVVSCHLPATAQTKGLLNAARFAKMKPTAHFINTSRGEVVVESDLLDALKSGKIAGAALDVRMSSHRCRRVGDAAQRDSDASYCGLYAGSAEPRDEGDLRRRDARARRQERAECCEPGLKILIRYAHCESKSGADTG